MIKHSGCVSRDRHIVCFHVQECMCIDFAGNKYQKRDKAYLRSNPPTFHALNPYIRNENERSILL